MNHNGDLETAKRLIDAAAESKADVAKFQTHIAIAETLESAPSPAYFKSESRYQYFERTAFKEEQWQVLKAHCEQKHLEFLSSPFSEKAVELLERVGVARYKVPSGEVTNLPLLERIAQTGKPIFLSSGMSNWKELDEAVNTVLHHHNRLTLLQCTSAYPCPYEQVGLNVLLDMKDRYKLPIGLSDHTLTNYAAFAAVTLGAIVIEKHFTLSRHMYGSDVKHSLEPLEFTDLVRGIRAIETMLSHLIDKNSTTPFTNMKQIFEKSVVSITEIPIGAIITAEMIGIKKPGTGLPARYYQKILGCRARRHVLANQILSNEDVDWK